MKGSAMYAEQVRNALFQAGAYCGSCGYEDGPCKDCHDCLDAYERALEPLFAAAKAEVLLEAVDDFSVNLTVMSGPRIRAWLKEKADKLTK